MNGGSGFPIDLVLFGLIAAFLVLRLRSILGRRTGFERTAPPPGRVDLRAGPVIEARAEPVPQPQARPLPGGDSPTGLVLAQMRAAEPGFDPQRFLDGAEQAFRLIVGAFAAGDRVALRPLLTDDTYRSFEGEIARREAAGETQRTEIRAVPGVSIEQAELRGRHAEIVVRFVSDQINVTSNASGEPVQGTDAVTELADLWTFERELGTRDPTWRLAAARSA
jgi:predicted lipid-binding transport protein (Tim44 family)